MFIDDCYVWAGSEASLRSTLNAQEGVGKRISAGEMPPKYDEDTPRLLQVMDGVAVVAIKGPLTNADSPWNEAFGITSYSEIREALIAAVQDDSVNAIILDVDSGGGAVSGVQDTAKLIRTVNGIKPVVAYGETMASAAYWLGSAAGEVYNGKTSLLGSIGVLSTHMERSEQLKMEGVRVNVIRAGSEKALANSVEPLSDKGRKQIQQVVDAAYGVFIDSVSEMRGRTLAYVDDKMAQGREFVGQAAVDAGLSDGISTFDDILTKLRSNSLPSAKRMLQNRGNSGNGPTGTSTTTLNEENTMARKALSIQDIAALAAGGVSAELEDGVQTDNAATEGDTSEGGNTDAGVEGQGEQSASTEAQGVQADTQKVDTLNATIQLLNSQVSTKDAAILEAGIKISKLEEGIAEAKATHGPLLAIATKSVGNMMVALGGSAVALEGLSAVAVLAEHDRLVPLFQKKYPVGGVAAVQGNTDAESGNGGKYVMTNVTTAQINAVRGHK